MTIQENTGQTADGFLVGVDPAQPRMAADWVDQTGNSPQQQQAQPQALQQPAPGYTDEDLARARREEKDKLYPEMQAMKQQLAELRQLQEAEAAEKQRLADEAETARREREEAELSTKELLARRDEEWSQRFNSLEQQREQDRAIYEQERRLAELEAYRTARIDQEQEYLLPEIRRYITGNTPEEIDASIEAAKADSESIFNNMTQYVAPQQQVPFQQPRGASPTAPPVGPLETQSHNQDITPHDIATMDMETYKRNRHILLPAAGRAYQRGGLQ